MRKQSSAAQRAAGGVDGVRIAAVAVALGALVGSPAYAWRSPLYPEDWVPPELLADPPRFETDAFLQDFSYAGYRRGNEPIPDVQGAVFDVVELDFGAHPNGVGDSTAAIQLALDRAGRCANGLATLEDMEDSRCALAEELGRAVVYVPPGHYRISLPPEQLRAALTMRYSGVVLRGAGAEHTFLFNETTSMVVYAPPMVNNELTKYSRTILRVSPGTLLKWKDKPSWATEAHVTADLLVPTTVIPLESVAGFDVGDWVVLRSDLTHEFNEEHQMADRWDSQVASEHFKPMFVRQIVAVDHEANEIRIDVPTRYYLKTRDNARVHHIIRATTSDPADPEPYFLEEVALEGFSIGNIEHPNVGSGEGWGVGDAGDRTKDAHWVSSYAISVAGVRNGWIRDVHTYRHEQNTTDSHVLTSALTLQYCVAVTVQDSSFQKAMWAGDGGYGYMVSYIATQEVLVADTDVGNARHGFTFSGMATSGNVILRGVAHDTGWRGIEGTPNTAGSSGSDHHAWLSQANLIDATAAERDYFAAFWRVSSNHGTTAVHTVFWNVDGREYPANYGTYAGEHVIMTQQGRYGYAIGTRGPASRVSISGVVENGQIHPAYAPFDPVGRTAPLDHVEGEGSGELLQPPSLYVDQLARRLQAAPPVGRAVVPTLSPAAGTYPAPVLVTVSSTTAGAEVRYSLDGSEPTEGSPLYVLPIAMGANTRLRARAFSDGLAPSAEVDGTYRVVQPGQFGVLISGTITRAYSPVEESEVGTPPWQAPGPGVGDPIQTAVTWACGQSDVAPGANAGAYTLGTATSDIGGLSPYAFTPDDLARAPEVPGDPSLETRVGPGEMRIGAASLSNNGSYIAKVSAEIGIAATPSDTLPCAEATWLDGGGTVFLFEDDASNTSVWYAEWVADEVTWLFPPTVAIAGPTTFVSDQWVSFSGAGTDTTSQGVLRYHWSSSSSLVQISDPDSAETQVMVTGVPVGATAEHPLTLRVQDRFGLWSTNEVMLSVTTGLCGDSPGQCDGAARVLFATVSDATGEIVGAIRCVLVDGVPSCDIGDDTDGDGRRDLLIYPALGGVCE